MVEGAENTVVRNAEVALKLAGTYTSAAVQQLLISPPRVTYIVVKYAFLKDMEKVYMPGERGLQFASASKSFM